MSASFIFLHHSSLITPTPLCDMDLLSGATLGWSPGFSDSSHWHLVSSVTYFAPWPLNMAIVTFLIDIFEKLSTCFHYLEISNPKLSLTVNSALQSLNRSSGLNAIHVMWNRLQAIILTLCHIYWEGASSQCYGCNSANILNNKSFTWIAKRVCYKGYNCYHYVCELLVLA